RMRVQFQSAGGSPLATPWSDCHPGHSMNFYLAGMRANTQYTASHTIDSGADIINGPHVSLQTPVVNQQAPHATMLTSGNTPTVDGFLVQSPIGTSAVATDLAGNLVWYSPSDISFVTRPEAGGTFLAIGENQALDRSHQFF